MVARTDGALIAGAKQSNPIHSQLTRERDRGSPFWQPTFDGGRSVRFLSRDPHQAALDADWPAPRIVYLQHCGDGNSQFVDVGECTGKLHAGPGR